MAELNVQEKGGRRTPPPRVDLTPMVDLGFLLITFFMFTTTLTESRTLEMKMPVKEEVPGSPTVFPASRALTLMPGKGHVIKYYKGVLEEPGQVMECGVGKVTDLVNSIKARVMRAGKDKPGENELYVVIKPADHSSYSDVVAVMDAMLINDVQHYALTEQSATEKEMAGW